MAARASTATKTKTKTTKAPPAPRPLVDVELELPDKVFRRDEIAERLGVAPRTVNRLMHEGKIQTVPLGGRRGITREEMRRLLREGTR
jgi:excisionase family DNA binding protein